jgi:cellulose synthase operon protein C
MPRITRIKLQWGASSVTPGDWYLGLFGLYGRKIGRGTGLAVSMRGLLLWSLLACVIGYFSGAGYFWWKQERRPYNYVRYTDVLLYPLSAEKRREVRELQGKALIADALDAIKEQQWSRGLNNLHHGLERYPRDLTARLKFAQIYLGFRLRTKAQAVLMQGLDYGWPGRAYLQSAIEMAAGGEDYELVAEICTRALALHDPAKHSAADRRWLIEQKLRALIVEKRTEDALAFAERESGSVTDATLSELRLLALLQAGRAVEAVELAEAWVKRVGSDGQALRLLARSYREAGRLEDMKRSLARLRADAPADPRILVFSMHQHFLAGLEREGRLLLDDYVFRFGGTEANFVLAAEMLAETRRGDELEVVLAAAAERGFHDSRLFTSRLLVLIAGRRWAEATSQIYQIRSGLPAGASARAGMLDFFQYLVAAASDSSDGAQTSLVTFVRERQLTMAAYRQCVETLRTAGRIDTARQIVTFAQGSYPQNKYLADTVVALDKEIADRRAAEEAARPVAAPVAAFASAEAFFKEVDAVDARSGPKNALSLFSEMRRVRPDWLAQTSEAVERRELELRSRVTDIAALQSAVRSYLTAERARIQAVVSIATRLHEEKRDAEARMLLTEILKKIPGEPAATNLMARWFPAPKAAPAPAVPPPASESSAPATAPSSTSAPGKR